MKVEEKQDLWELVRQKLEKDGEPETTRTPKKKPVELIEENVIHKKEITSYVKSPIELVKNRIKLPKYEKKFLNQGIFAGFIYILTIMVVLGILMVPGSITAAIGGYFGGRKSGDPARALTAAMLPFLIIASVSIMGSIGALPPGSGPNDLSENLNELIGYKPDNNLLGPISKMPDNNSSVFLSLVTFAFIGGLVEVGRKNKFDLS